MLDSQLYCPYIESREVPEKTRQKNSVRKIRGKYGKKAGGNISLSSLVPVHDFRSLPVTYPVMQLSVMIPHKYDLDGAYILLSCHIYKRCELETRSGEMYSTQHYGRFIVFNATFNNISVYRGGQFYWWRKPEYPEKITTLPEVTEERKITYPINYFDYRKIMRLVHIIYFRFHIANLENDEFSTTMWHNSGRLIV